MSIRPNAPAIMQCTSTLTPIALYHEILNIIDSAVYITQDRKGRAVDLTPVQVAALREAGDNDSISVVREDELIVRIDWQWQFGYRIYNMTVKMRARDPAPQPSKNKDDNKFMQIASYECPVPCASFVMGAISEARMCIITETERLKHIARAAGRLAPAAKKFAPRARVSYR